MNNQWATGLTVKDSPIDGQGCFTTQPFKKGRKIAEYVGERISRREIKKRLAGLQRIQICAIDSYWAIDGAVGGNGTQFVNHSCVPNCYVKIIQGHILFFALRDLAADEELLLDYELSWHGDDYRCRCGAPNCRGKLNK
jgi:SET domain-containing protein